MAEEKEKVFRKLKSLLTPCARGLEVRKDDAKMYELWGAKTVVAFGKEREGVFFAAAALKKKSASLYFFPIYSHPGEFKGISPELRKRMTGKSCFDLPREDKALLAQVAKMIRKGASLYKKIGWV